MADVVQHQAITYKTLLSGDIPIMPEELCSYDTKAMNSSDRTGHGFDIKKRCPSAITKTTRQTKLSGDVAKPKQERKKRGVSTDARFLFHLGSTQHNFDKRDLGCPMVWFVEHCDSEEQEMLSVSCSGDPGKRNKEYLLQGHFIQAIMEARADLKRQFAYCTATELNAAFAGNGSNMRPPPFIQLSLFSIDFSRVVRPSQEKEAEHGVDNLPSKFRNGQ
ncbi:MAG: hypothetical protein Q9170_001047 [Blastenia crenularia]